MAALVGTVSVTHQRQVPAVFAELVDGASLLFFDRVVVLAVILQRQVVDIPVMAQLQDLLVYLPLRLTQLQATLIRCLRCPCCAGPADSCEVVGYSRDPTVAARILLDRLLLARCVQQQCPWSMTRCSSSTDM